MSFMWLDQTQSEDLKRVRVSVQREGREGKMGIVLFGLSLVLVVALQWMWRAL